MTISAWKIPTPSISNNLFTLNILLNEKSTEITMQVHSDKYTTEHLPQTYDLLENSLPSILSSKCYNPDNFPFVIEVRKTEIAHLFEHILLECLAQENSLKYPYREKYKGITSWNWKREEKGLFRISINVGGEDSGIFVNALEKSVILMQEILDTENIN